MEPEDMEPFDEEAEGEDRLNTGELQSLLPEDQDSAHFGDDGEPSLTNELDEEDTRPPDAIVNVPVNPLQFIQEAIVRGLLDSLEPFQKTRGACFQMALTLKPNAEVDELLTIAHWIFVGSGEYNGEGESA
jgi:hypothetical protein